jgi:hypothetical protein
VSFVERPRLEAAVRVAELGAGLLIPADDVLLELDRES